MSKTVLIADDDRAIRMVLSQALAERGHHVKTAANAATLWQWVKGGEGDVIVTDVMMPVVGGLELIGLLKAINPDVRVIAASGLMHGEIAKNLSNAGALALLSKPYTADKLLGTLREVLSL